MKKFLGLSLCALMVLGLTACGGTTTPAGEDAAQPVDYVYVYTADLDVLDYVSTNKANNHEHNVNFVEGLLENNNLGELVPAAATEYSMNEDATVWTFKIREGIKWVTATGEEYAEMTAQDFVTGLQHAADANSETLPLVEDMIVGLADYHNGLVSFDEVGVKAIDDYTLEYTLTESVPYFYTMTTYPILYPINAEFLESRGCPLGETKSDSCTFGTTAPDSILYSGPFILTTNDAKSQIAYRKNESYWDLDNVHLETITYIYDDQTDVYSVINGFEAGTYVASTLNAAWADIDAYREKYADNLTLALPNEYSFGIQWNFNRVNFNYTNKDAAAQEAAKEAIWNKNVRLAVLYGFDRMSYLMQNMDEETARANLRNLNNVPDLVSTSDGTTYGTLVSNYYSDIVGQQIDLSDGQDPFYDPDKAMEYIEAAKADGIEFPITLDVMMPSDIGEVYVNRGLSMKSSIEESTQGNIIIDVILAPYDTVTEVCFDMQDPSTAADYDFNTFSGWGPDYTDPRTFANTFSIVNGDYLKNIGLQPYGTDAASDEAVEAIGLDTYQEMIDAADAIKGDLDARYDAYAQAEAYLLTEGLYIPLNMQSRNLRVTKVVPFSAPYALGGSGGYKMKYTQLQNEIVTKEQYDAAQAEWEAAKSAS